MSFLESLASTMIGALCGALGGLIVAGVVAWRSQLWIEGRERRNRRYDLRLNLYLEIVDLVLENDKLLAQRGAGTSNPSVEIQEKWFRTSHRLALLGSQPVREAYHAYYTLVYQEVVHAIQYRHPDPQEVVRVRNRLIDAMANDVQMK